MGVAVLQPQDCLGNPSSSQPIISSPSNPKMKLPNPKSTRSSRTHPNRPKRATRPASTSDVKPQPQVNKLVMGQVKILKRGEEVAETAPDRQPETVENKLSLPERVGGLYAGSSMFVASPPPSSVPLPVFVTKKIAAVTDATSDLRKMLQLDFS